jgi:hypothetical protein
MTTDAGGEAVPLLIGVLVALAEAAEDAEEAKADELSQGQPLVFT